MKFLSAAGVTYLWGKITAAFQPKITASGVLKGDGAGGVTAATAGTDYQAPISNNVTGSGTSGYIAKFNGGNTITNGPALGSSTTTYLRNDGQWATPASLPSQSGQSGKYLYTNGTSASWVSLPTYNGTVV